MSAHDPKKIHEEAKQHILSRVNFDAATEAPQNPYLIKSDFHFDDDLGPEPGVQLKSAAVLVPILERDHDLTILLTRRADHLDSHSGQVAFPGGKMEHHDEGLVETALRETYEEIGIANHLIKPIGFLDDYETGTGFTIRPVVGFVDAGVKLNLDRSEVAEAFEVPFSFLMDPANHTRARTFWRGRMREYYDMPYNGQRIWGATAAMLVNFYTTLYGS